MRRFRDFLSLVGRRDFWVGVGIAAVTIGIIVGTAIGSAKIDAVDIKLSCQSARNQRDQLEGITRILEGQDRFAERLGVPFEPEFPPIPEVPPECDGFSLPP